MKTIYVCEGTCQAKISEEQYNNGLKNCGADVCTMKGHEFAKKFECEQCGAVVDNPQGHTHAA